MSGSPEHAVETEARLWIGTPYLHQASCRGAGADCLGLVRGVWRGLYGVEPEASGPYTADWSEPRGEERLWQAALRHMVPAVSAGPRSGELLLFRMRRGAVAKHLGIASRGGRCVIHAYARHGVVESTLCPSWRGRIAARFTFPQRSP
ncbi:NlpC/P60 family protein [Profundibacterium mesophilum]|uniref:NlpC/P60 family domain containing protein n=1 Tax=Profundibacterium mesophilum KAUST100406-0324 TaxID=1037889 RepID=A0A921P1E5_9RHOB|nr:NlpC/P60 family protein [Profundibacterium mesophilum]KAF0677423.1 NlpC/P60 family domain containing protein [Profundibacterium mesophilum KAUST100406-0324]